MAGGCSAAAAAGGCAGTRRHITQYHVRFLTASSIVPGAISGSSIQNSAKWRDVLLFSARNVGPADAAGARSQDAGRRVEACNSSTGHYSTPLATIQLTIGTSCSGGGSHAPNVYTRDSAQANASRCSCPETVR